MRLYIYLSLLAVAACAPPKAALVATPGCDYSKLSRIASEPQKANGKVLCASLYSYSKHGFLAFYDKPVTSTSQAINKEALLIGDNDALRNFGDKYPRDGQKVLVSGRIDLQLSCFAGKRDSCVPIKLPIYVQSFQGSSHPDNN